MAQQRVTLGLQFAAPLPIKVDDGELKKLYEALPKGEWFEAKTEDGTLRVNLSQVVYVKTDEDEQRVGFG